MSKSKLQTLDRGIAALLLIGRTPGGLKVADLAAQLDLKRAVAYRIVGTLSDHAMLRRLDDGHYILGSGAYLLGGRAIDRVERQARPVLEDLAECTGATAFLSMAEGSECVVALTAEPRNASMNIHYRVGTRHPITRGAAGIAILAARPEMKEDSDDIRFARTHGYSLTRGQLHKGAIGISSAVQLPDDDLAGLAFSIGVVALEELATEQAAEAVTNAAKTLADSLQHSQA
ncbi:IclR family transcriptional regulator [Lentibacter sp. XHP0401]|jgi:DNA-binding IclR family transcriptional regulator|uniref:IclR family transcriptional regulator n=1 Tax=Lentibacter sp. XHP0401 TaxID=2984334 RepID=UPI0021E9078A|nr:helix-turn-helix domain-containing protein [Lentibacter sp. XHP0401]MCV2893418.1 helix-turn-helix domain-containing protein [Lentibacter sp. XHP0401]